LWATPMILRIGSNKMVSDANSSSSGLRVAVLSDIHGNIRALDAVLKEIERERPDRIVFCGDAASGPFPSETLARLMELEEQALFVHGNADRALISAFDRQLAFDPEERNPALLVSSWNARQIDQEGRDFLAGFEDFVTLDVAGLGRTYFCHGSPRTDEEIITLLTPEGHLLGLFQEIQQPVLVCGHTHHQFDRRIRRYRVINPGSVGMPYQGRPGAYWALLGPEVVLHRTEYDYERAVGEAIAADYPDPSYRETLLSPPQPQAVAEFFEKVAVERGERDGEEPVH
jgi:predicted phosphodiesterase